MVRIISINSRYIRAVISQFSHYTLTSFQTLLFLFFILFFSGKLFCQTSRILQTTNSVIKTHITNLKLAEKPFFNHTLCLLLFILIAIVIIIYLLKKINRINNTNLDNHRFLNNHKFVEVFHSLSKDMTDFIWEVDHNLKYTYVSPNIKSITGFSENEILGKTPFDLMSPAEFERIGNEINTIVKDHEAVINFENSLINKNGEEIVLETSGIPIFNKNGKFAGFRGIDRVISDRKKIENALKKNEAMLRALVDNIPFDFWAMDNTETYIMQNATSRKNWGDIIGKKPSELGLAPEDEAKWKKQRELALNGEIVEEDIFFEKNGTKIHINNLLAPIYEENKIIGILGVAINITDRIEAEEKRKQLEVQLRQSQKLESIGRLAGGIAHDFNNMLTPIIGYSDLLLLRKEEASKRVLSSVQNIKDAAIRAKNLTFQMLAFSRKQALEIHVLNINSVIKNFSIMIKRTVREDILIEYFLLEDIANINADISQIEQVILNLIINAQEAIVGEGVISIYTKRIVFNDDSFEKPNEIIPGEYIALIIKDNGMGMDKETADRLFEPFYTTKNHGTGLGLATVYGIIKQHNGYIYVDSTKEIGTEFKIYFPAVNKAIEKQTIIKPIENNKKIDATILLVEDTDEVRKVAKEMLENFGCKVFSAKNGLEALKLIEQHDNTIDLLFTDMVMPEISGVDLYRQLLVQYPNLKVLYMSGYTDSVIAQQDVYTECEYFIQKPFSVDDLKIMTHKVLGN